MVRVKDLVADATQCLDAQEVDRALAKANQALALSRELEDACGIADAIRIVVHVSNHLHKCDEAVDLAKEQKDKIQEFGDSRAEATILLALAETYSRTPGKHEEALMTANEAAELFHDLRGAQGLEAEALLVQMNVHIERGDSRSGDWLSSYRQALDLGKKSLEMFQVVVMSRARRVQCMASPLRA